jgi:hypothetical protein
MRSLCENESVQESLHERRTIGRIHRQLSSSERLRVCPRNSRWYSTLGRYYVVDERNTLLVWGIEDINDLQEQMIGGYCEDEYDPS